MLLYRRGAAPKILFNDWRTDKGLSDIRAYLQGPYRLDPFYRLALDNGDDGLYRLRQIDPSFDRSQYYRDYYRHSGLHDEFNFFIGIDADTKIAISLARRHAHAAFSGEDQDFLQSAAPLLSMAVLRHYRDLRPESLGEDGSPLQSALAQAIRNFGRSLLTDRECQVAQMILRGYSVKGRRKSSAYRRLPSSCTAAISMRSSTSHRRPHCSRCSSTPCLRRTMPSRIRWPRIFRRVSR